MCLSVCERLGPFMTICEVCGALCVGRAQRDQRRVGRQLPLTRSSRSPSSRSAPRAMALATALQQVIDNQPAVLPGMKGVMLQSGWAHAAAAARPTPSAARRRPLLLLLPLRY